MFERSKLAKKYGIDKKAVTCVNCFYFVSPSYCVYFESYPVRLNPYKSGYCKCFQPDITVKEEK